MTSALRKPNDEVNRGVGTGRSAAYSAPRCWEAAETGTNEHAVGESPGGSSIPSDAKTSPSGDGAREGLSPPSGEPPAASWSSLPVSSRSSSSMDRRRWSASPPSAALSSRTDRFLAILNRSASSREDGFWMGG